VHDSRCPIRLPHGSVAAAAACKSSTCRGHQFPRQSLALPTRTAMRGVRLMRLSSRMTFAAHVNGVGPGKAKINAN
jgi:hypothetical protein